ncbi:MAG TPA: hypothetical protein VH639_23170 [Bryobacteraceae bacterium]|jgi:metal-responsive CopG/Arc/MetJ family transcriptional regulator
MTHTIEVSIPGELLKQIDRRAQNAGVDREEYIRAVLAKDVKSGPSLSEILAPFRAEVAASGITDEELQSLFARARDESYRERRSHRS